MLEMRGILSQSPVYTFEFIDYPDLIISHMLSLKCTFKIIIHLLLLSLQISFFAYGFQET